MKCEAKGCNARVLIAGKHRKCSRCRPRDEKPRSQPTPEQRERDRVRKRRISGSIGVGAAWEGV
jgi:hypothetical protein